MPTGIVAPNEGLPDHLAHVLRVYDTAPLPWKLGIFVNDVDPDQPTVFADLTEPDWPGYVRKDLDVGTWNAPAVVGDKAASEYGAPPFVFRNDSSHNDTVYGIFVLDELAGVLRFVERFEEDDVRELTPGGQVTYLPKLTAATDPNP